METFKFYLKDDKWYVDLPEWEGSIDELEMVEGADTFLYFLAENESEVFLAISENMQPGFNKLVFIREADELENGAFYNLEKYYDTEINLHMWLCDVTKFVFGNFPKNIYFKKIV